MLNKYLKCSVWRLALRYDIYIYIVRLRSLISIRLSLLAGRRHASQSLLRKLFSLREIRYFMKSAVFWEVTPWCMIEIYGIFRKTGSFQISNIRNPVKTISSIYMFFFIFNLECFFPKFRCGFDRILALPTTTIASRSFCKWTLFILWRHQILSWKTSYKEKSSLFMYVRYL